MRAIKWLLTIGVVAPLAAYAQPYSLGAGLAGPPTPAQIGALTTNNPTATGTLSVPNVNLNSSSGNIQINGSNVLHLNPSTQYREGLFLGPRSGTATITGTGFTTVGIGPDSLRYVTNSGSESVALGGYTCEFLTTAYAVTCLGEHAVGFDNSSYLTAVGNDSMRNTIGATNSTAVGAQTIRDGVGNNNTALGFEALQGNSGSVLVSGTPHTGDVLSVSFSSTNSNVVGLPATASYTVVAGDTLYTIASGLINSINNLNISYTYQDGVNSLTENGVVLGAFSPYSSIQAYVALHFPGGQTSGWSITPTTSCVGTCSETLTVFNAMSGTDNIGIGTFSLNSFGLTTGSNNVSIGDGALEDLISSASSNVAIGYLAGQRNTTDFNNVLIGQQAGQNLNGSSYNILIGFQAGVSMTTGGYNVVIGPNNNGNITTGLGNVAIGFGATVPDGTQNWQLSIQDIIYGTGNNIGPGGSGNSGYIGIGTTSPNAIFTIGDPSGGQGAHIGVQSRARPSLSSCGTSPSISTTASDTHGTVTEGTTATGCTITFEVAYATTPDCVISSPSGNTATSYTTSTTTLTIVNASAAGDKFSYVCMQ